MESLKKPGNSLKLRKDLFEWIFFGTFSKIPWQHLPKFECLFLQSRIAMQEKKKQKEEDAESGHIAIMFEGCVCYGVRTIAPEENLPPVGVRVWVRVKVRGKFSSGIIVQEQSVTFLLVYFLCLRRALVKRGKLFFISLRKLFSFFR